MNNKEFFKNRKFINGWVFHFDNLRFDAKAGDVGFIYNDAENNNERTIEVIDGADYFYFYILKSDENLKKLNKIYSDQRTQVGDKYIRVYYRLEKSKSPNYVSLIKELEEAGIKTCEADISVMKRLCIDYDVQLEDWKNIKVLYFDIETDDTIGNIEIGRDRILSFAGIDKDGNEFYDTDEDEYKLLYRLVKLTDKYDMLVGWYSYRFDLPYILARIKVVNSLIKKKDNRERIDTTLLWNTLHEDMKERVQKTYMQDPEARQNISSYSLESISQYFLGEGKIEHKEKIIDMFNNNPEKLKEYNLKDVKLLKRLEDKLGIIELTYKLFQTCQVFAQNWSNVKTIDNFIMSDANKKGIHYKTNLNQMFEGLADEVDNKKYTGAFVLEPEPGYYEKVYVLDFKSLYPNIIRTFNISPDSVEDNGKEHIKTPIIEIKGENHGGKSYKKFETGVIPSKIGILLDDRAKIRAQMIGLDKRTVEYKNLNVKQLVVKVLANSIYGALGNKYFRSFDITLSESITVTGQYLTKWLKKYLEDTGRKTIYGDTDSVFLILKDKDIIEKVVNEVNENLTIHLKKEFNVNLSTIELAEDKHFDQFLITGKKKYIGKTGKNLKYTGMECIKRDTIFIAVKYQKELIEKIFNKCEAKDLKNWLSKIQKEILNKELKLEDITIRKKLSKRIELYEKKDTDRKYTLPSHVKVAKHLIDKKSNVSKVSDYSAGSIIQYVIIDGMHGVNEAKHISEYDGNWDRKYYWNNLVYPLLFRILKVVHKDEDWNEHKIQYERATKKKLSTNQIVMDIFK